MKAGNLENEKVAQWLPFCSASTLREFLLTIITCAQATVDYNTTWHKNDSNSYKAGIKENRTSLLQIDFAIFQFPCLVVIEAMKLTRAIYNESKERISVTLIF